MTSRINGEIKIITRDKGTGSVIDVYDYCSNHVVDEGVVAMWQRGSATDPNEQVRLDTIKLGDDFGDTSRWSVFNPEPPSRGFTKTNQNVTYTIPSVDYTFPTDVIMKVAATIDGKSMMDANFPDKVVYNFTSATLRFSNDIVFSFKRFPVRSISREVTVEIDWRFGIVNSDDWCADD